MDSARRSNPTAPAVPLELVRDDESSSEVKVGRNRKLTPAIFEKIMSAIEEGARIIPACRQHGITSKTLFMRVARDQEEASRFAQAKHSSSVRIRPVTYPQQA
jgi:hypothetical protein